MENSRPATAEALLSPDYCTINKASPSIAVQQGFFLLSVTHEV